MNKLDYFEFRRESGPGIYEFDYNGKTEFLYKEFVENYLLKKILKIHFMNPIFPTAPEEHSLLEKIIGSYKFVDGDFIYNAEFEIHCDFEDFN